MNIIDPTDAPGMQSAELGSGLIDDVSQLVVNTNSVRFFNVVVI